MRIQCSVVIELLQHSTNTEMTQNLLSVIGKVEVIIIVVMSFITIMSLFLN